LSVADAMLAGMRYGISMANLEDYADARRIAELARLAEDAGWDGVFVWDHVTFVKAWRLRVADPWILLTAAALATERVRLGTLVTPVARRRPSTLARQTTTLDQLSGGRLVLGVGLGEPIADEYGSFGEPTDARVLAERVDEGLAVLTGLWSGETVRYRGRHLVAEDIAFAPTPVQRPRIPIWVAGVWPHRAPFRRAAAWDGVVPLVGSEFGTPTPAQLGQIRALVAEHRAAEPDRDERVPFEVVISGETAAGEPAAARAEVAALAEAGATWWVEGFHPRRGPVEDAIARIGEGPPA
jgi:alkanesulfonate monooxygenase SsuD/methylene tetrahydromethanopterin reductase-like flavin-dependent oxidoreductase (luciferase family)